MTEFDQPLKEALEVYQAAHYIQGVESGVYCKETQASLISKVEAAREEAQGKGQEVGSHVVVICCLLALLLLCVVWCYLVWRLHAQPPPCKLRKKYRARRSFFRYDVISIMHVLSHLKRYSIRLGGA
jgi:hypothetical protein